MNSIKRDVKLVASLSLGCKACLQSCEKYIGNLLHLLAIVLQPLIVYSINVSFVVTAFS